MAAEDLAWLSVAEASRRIRKRELSPVDLVKRLLERISSYEQTLHAFVSRPGERELEAARRAEEEIGAGRWKGPLHGIPIGLKDTIETRDWPTTAHSAWLRDNRPSANAHAVQRLEDAGAILFGKLACWEFACGGPSEDLPWPPARHPSNIERDPGGSSSGSAVAVAAGFCLAALGTDTGGSVRAPAAYCGLAGLKPSYGLVSRRGVIPLAGSMDHVGPMCRTSEDCALLMQALAGQDPRDSTSAEVTPRNFTAALTRDIRGLRVGVPREFFDDASDEIRSAFERGLRALEELGALVRDVQCSPLALYQAAGMTILNAESFAYHRSNLARDAARYARRTRKLLSTGAFVSAADLVYAAQIRERLIGELAGVFEDVDVLALPTRPSAAAPFGMLEFKRIYTIAFNLTGNPALSVCTGLSPEGLPLSMQIVGRMFEDDVVLRVGHAYEQARGPVRNIPAELWS